MAYKAILGLNEIVVGVLPALLHHQSWRHVAGRRVQSQSRRLKSRYRPPDRSTINTVEVTAPECRPNPG
jgi:hypothetical protein